ncbi:MAG: DUF465 domain-containing protein [Acidobacteria bacterium]|nr:DUF465 domain-containing protein [Acidobacteriota bacterium]
MERNDVIRDLYLNNIEYKRIKDKHSEYDNILKEFQDKRFLTGDEEIEAKRLKKEKLRLKDQLEIIIREQMKKED